MYSGSSRVFRRVSEKHHQEC
ncbi:UNVERIFIED_CONTAM: hypothetical protein GTU68_003214 [Idotea baltica]|nr:hypothetical protein [Idotea baltica]